MVTMDPLAGIPSELWRLAASCAHRLLMLDYDGTLAPFTPARHDARPSTRAMDLLADIGAIGRTRLAVVSGRPIAELERAVSAIAAHTADGSPRKSKVNPWTVGRPIP